MPDTIVCEIRCPIHGFIGLNEWERRVVDHRVFQRLRRIRQLAWTDYVYPGAMHTRFEHSLGVMSVASRLYDSIVASSADVLKSVFHYTDLGLARDRQKIRLAALLHDVGHSPFSHGSEQLFPEKDPGGASRKHYKHEDYSIALIRGPLKSAIEDDDFNKRNYGITAGEIGAIIEGTTEAGPALFWRDLLSGQLDADRMDYLLRDSHHIGVSYGQYDLHRLVSTVRAFHDEERTEKTPRVGVTTGGWYAAEGLILARYSMHKQVYFHKTRIAYDIHLLGAMKEILPGGQYPELTEGGLEEYLRWDDRRVLTLLSEGNGGDHGKRLLSRDHYRLVYQTQENLENVESISRNAEQLEAVKKELGSLVAETRTNPNNWYKRDSVDIPVQDEQDPTNVRPLSEYSSLLKNFASSNQTLIYVRPEDAEEAKRIVRKVKGEDHSPQLKMEFALGKKKEVASA